MYERLWEQTLMVVSNSEWDSPILIQWGVCVAAVLLKRGPAAQQR